MDPAVASRADGCYELRVIKAPIRDSIGVVNFQVWLAIAAEKRRIKAAGFASSLSPEQCVCPHSLASLKQHLDCRLAGKSRRTRARRDRFRAGLLQCSRIRVSDHFAWRLESSRTFADRHHVEDDDVSLSTILVGAPHDRMICDREFAEISARLALS
jgi:hypothetical protein